MLAPIIERCDPDSPRRWREELPAKHDRIAELNKEASRRPLTPAEVAELRRLIKEVDETLSQWAYRTGRT